MPRGGKRPGAGRKSGRLNQKTIRNKEIAEKAIAQGITPLEVMLESMRASWDAGDKDRACLIAKDAAPYVHPKLSTIEADIEARLNANVSTGYHFQIDRAEANPPKPD